MTTSTSPETTSPKNILITGATGMVGRALSAYLLSKGYIVHGLIRPNTPNTKLVHGVRPLPMDVQHPSKQDSQRLEALGQLDAVVHLAGEPIVGRWSSEKKRRILDSRKDGTRTLSELLCGLPQPPRAFISASAIGIYGEQNGDTLLDETAPHGDDFLATVCTEWEKASGLLSNAGVRVAHARFGIILAKEGGALQAMLPAFSLGIGGILGPGTQWMSWVHLDDVVGALAALIDTPTAEGAFNVVAPEPETNATFTQTLGKVLDRPTVLPAPTFALKMLLGEMADALLLASQRCVPKRLQEELKYTFRYPNLNAALSNLTQKDG